jgi:hypothetical protein
MPQAARSRAGELLALNEHMTTNRTYRPLLAATRPKPTPEQRLMAAVLEDAIDVYRHGRVGTRRRLARDTEAWFRADDRSWPFSFVRICEALRLDPHAVRAALAQERLEQMLAA